MGSLVSAHTECKIYYKKDSLQVKLKVKVIWLDTYSNAPASVEITSRDSYFDGTNLWNAAKALQMGVSHWLMGGHVISAPKL